MGCKFSFKRVFLVASLSLAGLFGISSILVHRQVQETSIIEKAEANIPPTRMYIKIVEGYWCIKNPTRVPDTEYWSGDGALHACFYTTTFDDINVRHTTNYCEGYSWPGKKMEMVTDPSTGAFLYAYIDNVPSNAVTVHFSSGDTGSNTHNFVQLKLIPDKYSNNNTFCVTTDYGSGSYGYCQNGYWSDFSDDQNRTNYFLMGSGSFMHGDDWMASGSLEMKDRDGYKGSLQKQYLEKGDIFKITDCASDWYGWSEYVSGGSNFARTVMDGKDFKIECSVTVENSINWWENEGCKTRVITEGSDNPEHNLSIDLNTGYGTSTFEIYTDIDKIYFCRYNSSGQYNKDISKYGASLSANWDGYSYDWTVKYSWGSDRTESSVRRTGTNIKVLKSGYYDVNLTSSSTIQISSYNVFMPGESVYLDLNTQSSDWEAAGAYICARFWNSGHGEEVTNVRMTLVHNHGSNNRIYEAKVPTLASANPDYITFYRGPDLIYEHLYNEVNGLQIVFGQNTFGLSGMTYGGWYKFISKYDRANYFASYFIELTNLECKQDGSTVLANLDANAWAPAKTEYDNMATLCQGVVYDSDTSQTGTVLQRAMARYDYIVYFKQYTLPTTTLDFIERDDSGGRTPYAVRISKNYTIVNQDENDGTVLLIVICSSISILSITALSMLLVKKRKQQ